MKYQKCQIKHIVFLLIAIVIAIPLFSGCATENRVDYPFERAQKRANDIDKNNQEAKVRYKNNLEITDMDILGFTSELIEILGKQEKNYRIIRKVSTTLGVLAGTIATSIHGAIKADADTVTMFSAGAVLAPLLQQIWGAGEASQAKRKGINLITEAQSAYYSKISTGNNKGEVDDEKITPAGAELYKQVMAAMTVVGNAIAKQIPSLKDLQTAEGMFAVSLLPVVEPNTLTLSKDEENTLLVLRHGPATSAISTNEAVASIENFAAGSIAIRVKGKKGGSANIIIMNKEGNYKSVKVTVLKPLQIFDELNKKINIFRNFEEIDHNIKEGVPVESKKVITNERDVKIVGDEPVIVDFPNNNRMIIKGVKVGKFKVKVEDKDGNDDSFDVAVKECFEFEIDGKHKKIKDEGTITLASGKTKNLKIKSETGKYEIHLIEDPKSSNFKVINVTVDNLEKSSFNIEAKGKKGKDAMLTIKYTVNDSDDELGFKLKVIIVAKESQTETIKDPGVPGAIADVNIVIGDTRVDLDWTAPLNNLSPITEYEVQYGTVAGGNFNTIFTDDAVPGAAIIGLTNGVAYQFRVVAKNAVGTGLVSNIVNATPIVPTDEKELILEEIGRITIKPEDLGIDKTIFGALSGMAILPGYRDKDQPELNQSKPFSFVSVSDKGYWFIAELIEDENGKIQRLANSNCIYPKMYDEKDVSVIGDDNMAAEAVTFTPSNDILVSFEQNKKGAKENRIWKYSFKNDVLKDGIFKDGVIPPDPILAAEPYFEFKKDGTGYFTDKDFVPDKGVEAMTFDSAGKLIMISENPRNINGINYFPGWILKEDRKVKQKIYLKEGIEGLRPTGLAESAIGGQLILLEHKPHQAKKKGVKWKNTIWISKIADSGEKVDGIVLYKRTQIQKYENVENLDNFEGIAARTDAHGNNAIYIISDNNMKPSEEQETLLIKYIIK